VLKEIQQHLGGARVFTIGIDTAVNSGLLKRLAAVGGGTSAFVQPGAQLEGALINIGREIGVPLITDLKLEIKGMKLEKLAPNPVPDLFAGRAVTVYFRMPATDKQVQISLKGKHHDGSNFSEAVSSSSTSTQAIAQLWAKAFVNQLEDEYRGGRCDIKALKKQIVEIAKSHSLLTKFTAFVVVDESEVVNKDGTSRTVVQPVSEPALWEQQQDTFGAARGGAAHRMRLGMASPPVLGAPQFDMMQSAQPAPQNLLKSHAVNNTRYDEQAKDGMCREAGANNAPATLSESIKRKISDLGGGGPQGIAPLMGGAPPIPPMQDANVTHAAPRSDRTQLARSIQAFLHALEAVWKQVKAGQRGNGDDLAKAREALLKQLANSDVASELPRLQRFVRVEAQELIAALSSANASEADLQRLCASTEQAFISVKNEVESKLRLDATTGNTANFWETNI
jgi:hypothetical protein